MRNIAKRSPPLCCRLPPVPTYLTRCEPVSLHAPPALQVGAITASSLRRVATIVVGVAYPPISTTPGVVYCGVPHCGVLQC